MEEQERDEDIVNSLADALDNTLARHEKARLTRWLVLMEVIDEGGNYGLWTVGGPDSKPWDTLGMLRYAETIQKGEVMRSLGVDDE